MDFLDQPNQPNDTDRIHLGKFRSGRFSASSALAKWLLVLILVGQQSVSAAPPTQSDHQKSTAKQNSQQDGGDDSTSEIKELITQLGAADHLARNESQERLLEIGEPAIGPLQAVLNFEDSTIVLDNEVRLRATRLLVLIRRKTHKRKLAEFLDGTSEDIDLDGWADFRKIAGDKTRSRKLFVKLHQSRSQLLKAPTSGKDGKDGKQSKLDTENELHKTIGSRLRLSSNGNAESVIGNLGAVLFAASRKTKWDPDSPASAPRVLVTDNKRIQNVLVQPQMIATLQSHSAESEFKSLISHWLDSLQREPDADKHIATTISVIDAYQLSEKNDLTLRFALDRKLPARLRSSAIGILSRVGTADISPKLTPLLDDSTVVGSHILKRELSNEKPTQNADPKANRDVTDELVEVQIRDLALATAIILQDNAPAEFGFHASAVGEEKLVINQAGFLSEKERAAAFSKWNKRSVKKKN